MEDCPPVMPAYLFCSPQEVHARLKAPGETALLDVRERGEFARCHALLASCAPLSRIEMILPDLVPCRKTPVFLMDGGSGDGRAECAARCLRRLGWQDVRVMADGMDGWLAAGLVRAEGIGTLSKGFGEYIERQCGTPSLEPRQLMDLLDSGLPCRVIDVRPQEEYARMNIPGSINLPGCEVTYRFADAVQDAETIVVINCAGRTRSIIGAQTLINAQVPNKVYALKGGTMNWQLAGFRLEYDSLRRSAPPSAAALDAARLRAERIAAHYHIRFIDAATLRAWQEEKEEKTLYMFDVRLPQEYDGGHVPGSRNAQGGQLVQATDEYAAVRKGRFVLIDDTEVRAVMTAHWLVQMGLPEVYVLGGGLGGSGMGGAGLISSAQETAAPVPACARVASAELARWTDASVIDVGPSEQHARGHIPGALWCDRAFLKDALDLLPPQSRLVFTAEDMRLAALAAEDAAALCPGRAVFVLEGGTEAWMRSGLPTESGMPDPLCPVVDAWYRPYTDVHASPEAMRAYFDWEGGLVDCIMRDGCVQFQACRPVK